MPRVAAKAQRRRAQQLLRQSARHVAALKLQQPFARRLGKTPLEFLQRPQRAPEAPGGPGIRLKEVENAR